MYAYVCRYEQRGYIVLGIAPLHAPRRRLSIEAGLLILETPWAFSAGQLAEQQRQDAGPHQEVRDAFPEGTDGQDHPGAA